MDDESVGAAVVVSVAVTIASAVLLFLFLNPIYLVPLALGAIAGVSAYVIDRRTRDR